VTSRAKHQRKNKLALRPAVQQRPAPDRLFRMVAAANAGPSFSVGSELDLVKAALLYGDKVTLLSPFTTMLLRAEGLQRFTSRQLVELIRRLAPTLKPGPELPQFMHGLDQIDQLLRTTPRGSLNGLLLKGALQEALEPHQRMLAEVVGDVATQAGIDQLARARREGLVEIGNVDPGDQIDLLASCIVSAHLAQSGRHQDNPHTDRLVESFVDRLAKYLSTGRDYLLFDEPIASLTDAAIREGLFTPAPGPAGRSAQAMAASGLMTRLPTFPAATVDEVLDIRSDLAPSLTQFRSAMVTISKGFTSAAWESGFEDELHDAWVETVYPAIEAIEESISQNSSLLSRAASLTGSAKEAWPGLSVLAGGLSLLAGGVTRHVDLLQVLGGTGAVAGAAPILKALRERNRTHTDIRMQPFYFLYKTEHAL
jgi:hypothetical protein